MVHFITGQGVASVEETMGYVNNFIELGSDENVEGSASFLNIKREYMVLFEKTAPINRDYNVAVDTSSALMAQGRFARAKVFFMRVIRKCIRWYVFGYATRQTQFNSDVAQFINQEMRVLNEMNTEISRLRKEVQRLSVQKSGEE